MSERSPVSERLPVNDESIERMVSVLLRSGVLLSGVVVLFGGFYLLVRHHAELADFSRFHGEPAADSLIHAIVAGAFSFRARSIIQCGVLLLIATPILRVALSLLGFALERDRAYVWITGIVLCILLYSLLTGVAGG